MRDSDADIAIDVLNKLIDQELKAASAGMRDGNRILEECASTRYHAYTFARDEIRKALADAVEERDARNPFQCQRDELVTQDMHTCDLCGRWCPSPVYRVCLCYADQSRVASDVCADCMWRLGFRPVGTVPLEAYRRYEWWVSEHPTGRRGWHGHERHTEERGPARIAALAFGEGETRRQSSVRRRHASTASGCRMWKTPRAHRIV